MNCRWPRRCLSRLSTCCCRAHSSEACTAVACCRDSCSSSSASRAPTWASRARRSFSHRLLLSTCALLASSASRRSAVDREGTGESPARRRPRPRALTARGHVLAGAWGVGLPEASTDAAQAPPSGPLHRQQQHTAGTTRQEGDRCAPPASVSLCRQVLPTSSRGHNAARQVLKIKPSTFTKTNKNFKL